MAEPTSPVLTTNAGAPVPDNQNSMTNDAGERVWVKFHFKTKQGHRFLTNDKAAEVVGRTRERFQKDLFGAE